MRRCSAMPIVIASAAFLAAACEVALADAPSSPPEVPSQNGINPAPWNPMSAAANAEGRLDPLIFFDELVERYRGLTAYTDLTHIIQVTRHYDEQTPSQRTETRVSCELAEGELNVVTPGLQLGLQLGRGLGLDLPIEPSEETKRSKRRYDLWLLPHMALKFAEKPLEELREGVPKGFTATEAEEITIDDRPMVHLELTSGDGLSGDYNARFDLYVDPESMLIERIEGRQRLPDGGDFETTYHITPTRSEGGQPAQPANTLEDPATPATPPAAQPGTSIGESPSLQPADPEAADASATPPMTPPAPVG